MLTGPEKDGWKKRINAVNRTGTFFMDYTLLGY
jgi:hypothetical protein